MSLDNFDGQHSQELPWQVRLHDGLATAIFDSPTTHNVLSLTAIRQLTELLLAWEGDPSVEGVILRGADNRVFSIGGDLAALYKARGDKDRAFPERYFREEFFLDYLIATYPKPLMVIMNGLALGGGVGISAHAQIRIVTDTTLLAMPETGIGYFPDCGAASFLNNCPGYSGHYLALTGQRVQAPDIYYLGIGTHYVPLGDLAKVTFDTLQALSRSPRPAAIESKMETIDTIFNADRVEEIVENLSTHNTKWSEQALSALRRQCPLSLKVALRQLRALRGQKLEEIFRAEYRICQHFIDGKTLYEGIRASTIDKDNKPVWPTESLADILSTYVDRFFEPVEGIADWGPDRPRTLLSSNL